MSETLSPKFRNKDNSLTAYSFACGYIQWESKTGIYADHWDNGKDMYHEGCVFHVLHFKDGKRISWESFDTLNEARKHYKSIVI